MQLDTELCTFVLRLCPGLVPDIVRYLCVSDPGICRIYLIFVWLYSGFVHEYCTNIY